MNIEYKSKIKFIVTIIMLSSVVGIIYFSLFTAPVADDIPYSRFTIEITNKANWSFIDLLKAAIKTDAYYYNNWQGLYSSALILSLQPGIFGEQYYFMGTIFLLILIFVSLLYFVKTLNTIFNFNFNTWTVSLLLMVLCVQGMPNIKEGLYWFNGAWNYTFFFFLTILNVSFIIRYLMSQKIIYVFISCILSFVISGGNHVTGFLNILLLLLTCVYSIKRKKYYAIFPLVVSILGYGLMIIAPGTSIRQDYFIQQSVMSTIVASSIKSYLLISDWINAQWIAYIFLITLTAFESKVSIKANVNPLIILIISIGIICGMLSVPWFAMGGFGEGRVENVIWFAFIILSGLITLYFVLWVKNKKHISLKISRKSIAIITMVLIIIISFSGNSNIVKLIYSSILAK